MALIRCSCCGSEISDKAADCFHCGAAISKHEVLHPQILPQRRNIFWEFLSALVKHLWDFARWVLTAIFIWCAIMELDRGDQNTFWRWVVLALAFDPDFYNIVRRKYGWSSGIVITMEVVVPVITFLLRAVWEGVKSGAFS